MLNDDNVPNPLRLLNEWRDTAFIVCVGGFAGAGLLAGDLKYTSSLLTLVGLREFCRGMSWGFLPPKQIAGAPRNPDRNQVFLSSLGGSQLLFAAGDILVGNPVGLGVSGFFGATLVYMTGGPKAVHDIYKRVWDWPRKRGPGGPPETSKLKSLGGKMEDSMEPRPVRPARAVGPDMVHAAQGAPRLWKPGCH